MGLQIEWYELKNQETFEEMFINENENYFRIENQEEFNFYESKNNYDNQVSIDTNSILNTTLIIKEGDNTSLKINNSLEASLVDSAQRTEAVDITLGNKVEKSEITKNETEAINLISQQPTNIPESQPLSILEKLKLFLDGIKEKLNTFIQSFTAPKVAYRYNMDDFNKEREKLKDYSKEQAKELKSDLDRKKEEMRLANERIMKKILEKEIIEKELISKPFRVKN